MPDEAMPVFDRCAKCGREGRTLSVVNLVGTTGTGNRVLPHQGLELELAAHVGAATMAAGELDAVMSALRGMTGEVTLNDIAGTWGRSGLELTHELRKLTSDHDLDGDRCEELAKVCDRYDALYSVRNILIHSFRPGRDTERLDVVRAVRSTKANPIETPDRLFEQKRMGIGELIDLYYDLDDLTHDARNLYLRSIGKSSTDSA